MSDTSSPQDLSEFDPTHPKNNFGELSDDASPEDRALYKALRARLMEVLPKAKITEAISSYTNELYGTWQDKTTHIDLPAKEAQTPELDYGYRGDKYTIYQDPSPDVKPPMLMPEVWRRYGYDEYIMPPSKRDPKYYTEPDLSVETPLPKSEGLADHCDEPPPC